jgi:S-adenosylmethionine decarboxylase
MEKTRIYNLRMWLQLTDESAIAPALEKALREAGYGIVGFCEHHFSPQGYTCTWLLSESHCALHTFPEEGRSYIELSGCSEEKSAAFTHTILSLWKDYISDSEQSNC